VNKVKCQNHEVAEIRVVWGFLPPEGTVILLIRNLQVSRSFVNVSVPPNLTDNLGNAVGNGGGGVEGNDE